MDLNNARNLFLSDSRSQLELAKRSSLAAFAAMVLLGTKRRLGRHHVSVKNKSTRQNLQPERKEAVSRTGSTILLGAPTV